MAYKDYKYAAYELANEKALELYGKEFYDLPEDTQMLLYQEGLDRHFDRLNAAADLLRDEVRNEEE